MNSAIASYGTLCSVVHSGFRPKNFVRYSDFDRGFLYRAASTFGALGCNWPLDETEEGVLDTRVLDIVVC